MFNKNYIRLREADRRAIARDTKNFRNAGGQITQIPTADTSRIRPIGKVYGVERTRFHG